MKGKGNNIPQSIVLNTEQQSVHQGNSSQDNPNSHEISSKVLKGDSFFSRLLFSWITVVLEYGSQHPIDTNDLPRLHVDHHPKIEFDALNRQFQQSPHSSRQGVTTVKAITRAYKGTLIYIAILALLMTLLSMAAPTITHLIISYIKLPAEQKGFQDGLLLLGFTFGLALAKAITQSHLYFKFAVFGFNLSNTLSLLIYAKALKYPIVSQNRYSLGEIINLSQVDAQRMITVGPQLTAVIYTPLQIVIGVYLMYRFIGRSFTVGMFTMIGLITLTIRLAKKIRNINNITNQAKDKRAKITQQLLEIIRFIKVNTLEKYFYRRVDEKREEELSANKKRARIDVLAVFIFFITCPLIVFQTFFTFITLGNRIDAAIAFSTIMIFNILQAPLKQFPSSLTNIIQIFSSLKRIESFLLAPEINQEHAILCQQQNISIRIDDGTFGWINNKDQRLIENPKKNIKQMEQNVKVVAQHQAPLQTNQRYVIGDHQQSLDSSKGNIFDHEDLSFTPVIQRMSLTIENGKFIMILGQIGSGKSSLLLGILNEMKSTNKTTIQVSNSIAYSSQRPCIISGTLKDNILFGLPFDKNRFDQAIYLTALGEDLKQLMKGELTEIGEKGVNLSGGQKMRVSLARAIYSNRQILLLDDIVSAVDTNIAEFIIKVTLRGFLRGKTILLATHAVKFAQFADQIIIMREGSIVQQGSFKKIYETQQFQQIYRHLSSQGTLGKDNDEERKISKQQRKMKQTLETLQQKSHGQTQDYYAEMAVQNLIIPEDHNRGSVDASVLREYVHQSGGWAVVGLILGTMSGWLLLSILSNVQIEKWCEDQQRQNYYLYAYIIMAIGASLFAFARSTILVAAGLRQGREVHQKIIKSLLYASLNEFHERVPVGRIMNRLTKDLRQLDESMGSSLSYFLNNSFTLMGTIVICIYGSTWWMLLPVACVMHFCNKLRKYYMKTQRQMIRIEAKTSSPIADGFVSTINGLPTIRAFKMQEWFMEQQLDRIQTNKRSRITREALESWFALRLTLLSFLISIFSIAFALTTASTQPALVGLLLSYALTLNDDIITHTFSWANLEIRLVAIERVYNFMKIQPEGHYRQYCEEWSPIQEAMRQHIQRGEIEFKEIAVKYRNDLPDALHSLSFIAQAGQKIGIVGRTGAGKSTIFNTILKIANPNEGTILIDGMDYRNISAKDIRNQIAVIDQEPFIINSTIRENLDQRGAYSDAELHTLLEECELHALVLKKGGLDGIIDNRSLSAGEKQLLCICRAVLKKSKIVLVDEATANVDAKHDAIIQSLISKRLKNSTVLIIAHRLSTLSHVDTIIVMEGGRLVEKGSPQQLKNRPQSIFGEMSRRQASELLA